MREKLTLPLSCQGAEDHGDDEEDHCRQYGEQKAHSVFRHPGCLKCSRYNLKYHKKTEMLYLAAVLYSGTGININLPSVYRLGVRSSLTLGMNDQGRAFISHLLVQLGDLWAPSTCQ